MELHAFGYHVQPWLVSFVFFGGFVVELHRFWFAMSSSLWPWVRGRIEQVEIGSGDDGGRVCHFAVVTYSYTVRKKKYESAFCSFAVPECLDEEELREKLVGIYKGKIHRVYYQRNDPSIAVLKPGVDGNYLAFLLGLLLLAFLPLIFLR